MSGQEVRGMLIRLEATTAQLRQEMAKADSTVAQVSGRIDSQLIRVDSAFDRAGASAQAAASVLKGALSSVVSVAGISELLKHAEAYTTIANRLKLVTSGAAEFTAAQNAVFAIAQRSGQPLTATAELYQRIATNQKELKLSGQGVAGIVETISKTMVISGASTESANAALIQLGQAFASGTLRGEELNSVLEQAPALAQAIAKGMGVSVGALRSLGAAGKLTADSVVKALQAQAGAVNDLFGKMQGTVSQGMTKLDNSATSLIGKLDQTSGVSQKLAGVLASVSKSLDSVSADGSSLADTVDRVTSVAEKLAVVIGARVALAVGQSAAAFIASAIAAEKQALATAQSIIASDRAVRADAASAAQALLTAQSRQVDAKAMLDRANVELATAEQKVAADRVRQASEVANIQAVQTTLVAERGLEEQRLRAQITDTGRAQSISRIVELRQSEIAIANQVKAAETALAETSAATSTQIQAAYQRRAAAAGAYGETALAVNQAVVLSEKATAAASGVSRGIAGLSAAGGGLLALLTGPVGMIATVALVATSFIDFGHGTDEATKALISQHSTVDESIKKFDELGAAQRRFQLISWAEDQKQSLDSASEALQKYSASGAEAFLQIGYDANGYRSQFKDMIEEVRKGQRTLDSVTEWAMKDAGLTDDKIKKLAESSVAYEENAKRAKDLGKILEVVSASTRTATVATTSLSAAQQSSGQSDASKAAWDKYIDQLTKTRDLLGANAAAEAAYTAAKMGATPAQAAQAKIIADQTDVLKKYQDAIKESAEAEKVRLKAQLVALYTAEDASNAAAAAQKKAFDDTAAAAESSSRRQITAIEQAANFAVVSATRVAMGAGQPQQNLTGFGLLTNGGTAPVTPAKPKLTPDQRATAAVAQLDATTDANKRVDKAANAAATAIKNQAKALADLLAKSGISAKASTEMADAYLGGANSVRAMTIQQKIEEELLKTGAGARDKVTKAINAMQDAKDREDVAKHIADMRVEIGNLEKEAVATLQGQAAIDAFNLSKAVQTELIGKNIAVGSRAYDQLVSTTKAQMEATRAVEQANKANDIVDRLNPQIKLLKDYTAEQQALTAAMTLYPENAALYQDALVKLGNEYEVNRSKATLWGQMTEGAIDRIDEAFANAWANIGSGANNLWDNLKKGFKQTLGEIAHMLTTKPLLASISNWLTGTDNGQGLSSVWSKLLGGTQGAGQPSSGGGLMSSITSLGSTVYKLYSAVTGVGAEIASGYASGGLSGAFSGGVNYYGNMLSNLSSSVTSGFSGLSAAIFGASASQIAANAATSAVLTSTLSSGVTQLGGQFAANVGFEAIGSQLASGFATQVAGQTVATAATGAAAGAGAAAVGAGFYAQLAAMASNPVGWVIAAVTSAYQSGKLYDKGERWNTKEVMNTDLVKYSGGIGQSFLYPLAMTNKVLEKLVGGKMAAIFSGSVFASTIIKAVSSKIFGGDWVTKDGGISLGVEDGEFSPHQYVDQKKKGGLFKSDKKRTRYSALDPELEKALGQGYDSKIMDSLGLFAQLGVTLSDNVLDGLSVASSKISTQGKTNEQIEEALTKWFTSLGDSAVSAINTATSAGLDGYTFESLATFITNLYSVNSALQKMGVKMLDMSVAGGKAVESLASIAGGMEDLNTAMSGYYDGFTSDVQKSMDSLAAIRAKFAQLGVVLPDTEDGFKAIVQALDLSTAAGQNMFVQLTKAAADATTAYGIMNQRLADYYSGFYSESENTARSIKDTTQQIKALGVVLPGTRAEFRSMVEAAAKDTSASGKVIYETLLSVASLAGTTFTAMESQASAAAEAAAKAAQALTDALSLGANNAFSALQRSISAQQKAASDAYSARTTSLNDMLSTANTAVSDLTSMSTGLENALKSLRGTSDDSVKMLRSQAQATLQSALARARSGSSLANFAGLDDALDTVSSNNTDLYSSLDEFNREQGRTANVVAELNALNGKQLTSTQQTVKALQDQLDQAKTAYDAQVAQFDAQLAFAQSQLDALNGVDNSIMGVTAAINAMNASILAALKGGVGGGAALTPTNAATVIETAYRAILGRNADAPGLAYWQQQLASQAISVGQLEDAIRNAAKANGQLPAFATGGLITGSGSGTSDSMLIRASNGEYMMRAAAVRAFGTDTLDQMNALQIPAFATGGPVLDISSPSQVFSRPSQDSPSDGGDMATAAEVRELRREMEGNATYMARLTKTIADGIDTLVNSGLQVVGTVETKVATA